MSNTLFLVGDDKLGRLAIADIGHEQKVYLNRSSTPTRLLRLIRKGAIRPYEIAKMAWADQGRTAVKIPDLPSVSSNEELLDLLRTVRPERVVCFRAGLVLTQTVLDSGPQFLNVHCAELPIYAGLGALPRALKDGSFDQNACLHEMSVEVDAGQVLYREPYQLQPDESYRENEDNAYAAGRRILQGLVAGRLLS